MKTWKSPEMQVFDVRMDENIAASGETGTQILNIYHGNPNGEGHDGSYQYYVSDSGTIVNTEWMPKEKNGSYWIEKGHVDDVKGCKVV